MWDWCLYGHWLNQNWDHYLYVYQGGTNIVLSSSNVFLRVNFSTYNSQVSLWTWAKTLCQGDFFSFYFIQNIVSNTEMERTSEKSEMVTYKDTTQVARNMWVLFIWSKPLGRMGHNMLKWLLIYLLDMLALCLHKAELLNPKPMPQSNPPSWGEHCNC